MPGLDIRILIIDYNNITSKKMGSYLKDSGFNVQSVYDGEAAGNKILEFRPHFILIDIAMNDFTAVDCLDFLQSKDMMNSTKVFVLSGHNSKQNVDACLKRGAHDYLVRPINPMDILTRIALHMQTQKQLGKVEEIKNKDHRQANYYLNLTELLLKTSMVNTTPHQVNYQMLRMLSMHLNAVRISLIHVDPTPIVVASSDNPGFTSFPLQLEKYPELDYVLRTHNPLFIENLQHNEDLSFIKKLMKNVQFNTMIVVPVIIQGEIKGILSARLKESTNLLDADIRLCQVVAQIFCTHWQQLEAALKTKAS